MLVDKTKKSPKYDELVTEMDTSELISLDEYTVNDAIDGYGLGRLQYWLIFIASFLEGSDAMEALLISYLGLAMDCEPTWNVSKEQNALLQTTVFIGMMCGALFWGRIGDSYGRRPTLLFTAIVISTFGILSAFAWSYVILTSCRFFVGVGIAGVPTAFSLIMEFTPSPHRGKVGLYLQIAWTFGTVIQALLAWLILPVYGWRVLVGVSALPSVLSIFLFMTLPESPRFLCATGQFYKADLVLKYVAKVNNKPLLPGTLKGLYNQVDNVLTPRTLASTEKPKSVSLRFILWDMFVGPLGLDTIKLFYIWFTVAFVYYGLIIFTTATTSNPDGPTCGEHETLPLPFSQFSDILISSSAEFPGVIIAIIFIERWGRKPVGYISLITCTICFLLYALLIASSSWVVYSLFVARAAAMSIFCLLYVYTPEVYPTLYRATALGMATAFSRLGGATAPFLVNLFSPTISSYTFCVLSGVGAICFYTISRETKGVKLADGDVGGH